MNDFEVFKSFYSEEEALGLLDILKQNGLDGKFEKRRQVIDKIIVGDGNETGFFIKLRQKDFTKANLVLDEQITRNLSELDPDYYLFTFSNEELNEIIQKPDEWSNQDYVIAKKILRDRGENITDEDIQGIRSARLNELSRPEQEESSWIFLGYLMSVVLPVAGLVMGILFSTSKKVLPDGNKLLIYDSKTRSHGSKMIFISILMLALALFGIFNRRVMVDIII